MSPVKNSATEETSTTTQDAMVAGRYSVGAGADSSGLRCERTISQAHTPATKAPAVRNDAATACRKAQIAVLLVSSATKFSNSARPVSGLNRAPTGCCMNEFAAMMKYAEAFTANATIQMHVRCTHRLSRPQPKTHSPMKVDSKKKATRPSNASGAPKMSPTNREYSLQFMPNWNSCTTPVATPSAKLIKKSLPKNLVSRYQA